MGILTFTGIISAGTCLLATYIAIKWSIDTKGVWRSSEVGRSVMTLIIVTAIISGLTALAVLFPSIQLLLVAHSIGTLLFLFAVAMFGYSRAKLQRIYSNGAKKEEKL